MTTIAPGEDAFGAEQDALDRQTLLRWAAGLATLMGVSLIVAALLAARPVPPVRYVSPLFPDGTRYTFLYPVTLEQVHSRFLHGPGGAATITTPPMVLLRTPLGPFERLLTWSPFLWRAFPRSVQRQYIVLSYSYAPVPGFSSGAEGQNIRSESMTSGRNVVTHHITLMNTESGVRANFTLMDFGPGAARRSASDARVAASFRVLPPGAPLREH